MIFGAETCGKANPRNAKMIQSEQYPSDFHCCISCSLRSDALLYPAVLMSISEGKRHRMPDECRMKQVLQCRNPYAAKSFHEEFAPGTGRLACAAQLFPGTDDQKDSDPRRVWLAQDFLGEGEATE